MTRIFGILLLVPLGSFVLEALSGAGRFELHPRAWGATLLIAGGAALLSLAAGVPAGLVLAHARRRAPPAVTILPMLVPPALGAATWMGLGLPNPGPLGCAVILASSLWPVVALLLYAALTRIPREQIDAASLQLDGGRTMRRVIWPHARPALLAGALLVFLLAAADFSVPATFAVPCVSQVIYERLSVFEFAAAGSAALPLIALAVAAAGLVRRVPFFPQSGRSRPFLRGAPMAGAWAAAAAAWLLTAALPAFVFAKTVRTPKAFSEALALCGDWLLWSALVAGSATLLLLVWASLTPRRSRLEPLWLAGLVLPGIIGAYGAGRLGVLPILKESGALMVLALMARFAYAAWLPLRDPVERSQLEAAELAGLSRARAWRKIVLPALLPRALAAGAIVFVLCLGEIGPAVLLSPPGRQTLILHVFNLMHYGYDQTVASVALVLMAAAAVFAWMGLYVGRRHIAAVGD